MPENTMASRIAGLLRPQLGSMMIDQTPLCRSIAAVLSQYGAGRDMLSDLREAVEQVLFDVLYDTLGERMTLRLDNGCETRIWLRMLPDLADLAMRALFEALPVYSANYRILMEYTVSSGSLNAMVVIWQSYRKFLSTEDGAEIRRILAERCPDAFAGPDESLQQQ